MIRPLFRILSTPIAALAAAVLVLSAPSALRAENAEHPHTGNVEEYRGLYFAGGLGGGLQIAPIGGDVAAGGAELRIGYSLGRRFQIYLDADFGIGSQSFGILTANDVMLGLRYFLFTDRLLGVYARGGLGLGIATGNNGGTIELGIAESYAIGVEFRLGGRWALSPEVFYRRTNETQGDRVDTLGLGVLINFN